MAATIQRQSPRSRRTRAADAHAKRKSGLRAAPEPTTKLAAALRELRQQGIDAGEPLLSLDDILADLARSRGR